MSTATNARVFWDWFVAHEPEMREAYDAGDEMALASLLAEPVDGLLRGIDWEIGPYALPEYAFVLSPGARERISMVREIVESAPHIPGWRIFAAKPPKELESIVFIVGEDAVCADDWRYRCTSWNGGEFVDLEVFFEPEKAPPPGKEMLVCELVLEALVGELVSLDRIGAVEHHLVNDIETVEQTTSIRRLKEHLDEILQPIH